MNQLAEIITSLKDMRPSMRQMAAALDHLALREIEQHIERASLEQITTLTDALAKRARTLANGEYAGSANLDEAACLFADALTDLKGVPEEMAYEVHPYGCPCDSCAAMRSDEHHDRKRDAA